MYAPSSSPQRPGARSRDYPEQGAAPSAAVMGQPAEHPGPGYQNYYGAAPPVYAYGGAQQAPPPPPTAAPHGYAGKPPEEAELGDDWDLEAGTAAATQSAYLEKAEAAMRVAFMRKVYGILLTQLLATIGMACLFMFEPSANSFVLSSPRLLIAGLVMSFVSLIALICVRHKHPANVILLSIFTLIEAYTLGVVCASLQRSGAGDIVLQAFIITASIFIGLTAFTLWSKIDFSWLGAVCFAGLIGLLAWGLIIWIMGWRQSFIFSLIGAILFSLLIVYDTYLISKRLSPDEYILGAISLFLDLINLFLFLLQLLGAGRRD